jgi:hypothetical protein
MSYGNINPSIRCHSHHSLLLVSTVNTTEGSFVTFCQTSLISLIYKHDLIYTAQNSPIFNCVKICFRTNDRSGNRIAGLNSARSKETRTSVFLFSYIFKCYLKTLSVAKIT